MKEILEMISESFETKVGFIAGIIMLFYLGVALCITNPAMHIVAIFAAFPVMAVDFIIAEIIIDIHWKITHKK